MCKTVILRCLHVSHSGEVSGCLTDINNNVLAVQTSANLFWLTNDLMSLVNTDRYEIVINLIEDDYKKMLKNDSTRD